MNKIKILLLLFALTMPFLADAQKPGFQSYAVDSYVNQDGTRTQGDGSVWVKFEGDLAYIDMGVGSPSRYKYHETMSDGIKLYYFQAYNYGTMAQGSGWMTSYDSWLKVSPDGSVLNSYLNSTRTTTIYTKHTPSSAGGMIY